MLAQLLATSGVEERIELNGPVGVMALHDGLEARTGEMAIRAARVSTASLYVITQPEDLAWHVPSARHDPRDSTRLRQFLEHVRVVVSFHGFGRSHLPRSVLLGGSNRALARRIGTALRASTTLRVLDETAQIPGGLKGLHPCNPVNLAELGGVQVELSGGARREEVSGVVVASIGRVLAAESGSVCAIP